MTKSFSDIVDDNTFDASRFGLEIDGEVFDDRVTMIEVDEELNDTLKMSAALNGDSGLDEAVLLGNEMVITFNGEPFAVGIVQNLKQNSETETQVIGRGYSSALNGKADVKFTDANTSEIVNTLVDNTDSVTGKTVTVGTNEQLNQVDNGVVDFRAKKKQLKDVARLIGEYDGEWFISFDQGLSPKFNVVQQRGGGKPVKTFATEEGATKSGVEVSNNADFVEVETDDVRGSFKQVVVKGYGDGEDQIEKVADDQGNIISSPVEGKRTLIFTDKTIISERQAERKAKSLAETHSATYKTISVEASDPNQVFQVGDVIKVEDKDTGVFDTTGDINGGFRVVRRHYKITFDRDSKLELELDNKPKTFLSQFKQQENVTKSQTDHMQGSSNTINESNKEVSNSTSGTKIEFNVPERFVTDTAGNTRVKDARLDFSVDNFKRLIQASDAKGIDDTTKFVDTTVTDFGNVERVNTESKPRGDVDETVADFRQTDTTTSGAGGSYIQSATNSSSQAFATGGVDLNLATVDAGTASSQGAIIVTHLFVTPSSNLEPDDAGDQTIISYDFRVEDEGDNIVVPELQSVARTSHIAKFIQKRSYTLLNFDDSPDTSETQTLNFDLNLDSIPHINLMDLDGKEGADVFIDDDDLSNDEVDVTVENSDLSSAHDVGVEVASTDNPKVEFEPDDIVLTHRIPEDTDNREYTPVVKPSDDCFIGSNVSLYVEDEHIHQLPDTSEGADNVQAYTAKPDGTGGETDIDAGDGASQSDEKVPNQDTFTFGQLDSNELILSKKQTNAGQVTVKVNGTEITASPFTLSGSPPFIQRDIDLSDEIDSAGSFTVELVPDQKAAVKGNVIIDHKKDEDQ